jgi:hypothetical protein
MQYSFLMRTTTTGGSLQFSISGRVEDGVRSVVLYSHYTEVIVDGCIYIELATFWQ